MALKSRGQHDDVDLVAGAVGQLDAVRGDPPDRLRHQRDVVAEQHVQDAVVPIDQDRPSGHRGRLGRHLLQQVGTVAELGLEESDAEVPDLLVDGADCMLVPEVRVDLEVLEGVLRTVHERGLEPREVGEVREVAIEPVDLVRVRGEIAGRLIYPVGRALEDIHMTGFLDHLGDQLVAGTTGADHGDPLAGEIEPCRPARRVEPLAP